MAKVTYFLSMIAKEGKAEEVEETLRVNFSNVQEEKGNIVFAIHRSTEKPNEFWIYETLESQEAVDAHKSSARFEEYKNKLRPLVEGDTVFFGNTAPFAVKGYEV